MIITTFCIIVIVMLISLLFFYYYDGKMDKKTLKYTVILSVIAIGLTVLLWLLYDKMQLSLFYVFGLNLAVFVIMGFFHIVSMYELLWANRDTLNWHKDSITKEATFTFFLSSLITLIGISLLGYLTKRWEVVASMLGLVIAFPLPWIIIKTFDFLSQIPAMEFDKKWFYEVFPFDETQWKRENMISVGFIVADSLKNENKWFKTKARFSIIIPRDQELRLIYRLALREYHKKNPSVPVQELGYEEEGTYKFWWLFSFPFILWKPSTWKKRPHYLDPDETIANNQLQNGDLIVVKRMLDEIIN